MDWYLTNLTDYYRRLLEADKELSGLRKEIAKGDLAALQKYSTRAGQIEIKALQEASMRDGYSSLLESGNLKNTLDAVFQVNYQAVANASQAAQKAANQAAGLGIKASVSDYEDIADDIANKLAGYEDVREGLDKMANDIVLQSQKYADDSERKSASFANDSGLEVLVSREYDDVGVHTTDKGGGQPCQWCLDRCGTDVPYQEAYDRGMFERHPGCGCIITYKTKRGIFRQGKGDWEHNQWAEEPDRKREKLISSDEKSNSPEDIKKQLEYRKAYSIAGDLVTQASQKEKIVTDDLKQAVSQGTGHLEGLQYRLKGEESLARKLVDKSASKGISIEEYAGKVTDVLRYTSVSDKESLTNDFFVTEDNLGKNGYTVIEVTNTFALKNVPYKGINTLVKDKEGYVFELQFHTPQSLEVKEANHKLYEEARLAETSKEMKKKLTNKMIENASSIGVPNEIERIKDVVR